MTFNAFELGTVDAVKNTFDILSDDGVVIEEKELNNFLLNELSGILIK